MSASFEGKAESGRLRHVLQIETEETAATQERSDFLAFATGVDAPALGERERAEYTEEFNQILDRWSTDLPEHIDTVEWLRIDGPGSLFTSLGEAFQEKDFTVVDNVQQLCKAVLQEYGGGEWGRLSETQKRSIRMAEMGILLSDLIKIARDQPNPRTLTRMLEVMDRYRLSVDLPRRFREELVKGSADSLRQGAGAPQGAGPSQPLGGGMSADAWRRFLQPWEYGTIRDLWGRPGSSEEAEWVQPLPGAAEQLLKNAPKVTDVERNPTSGAYEAPSSPSPPVSPGV